MAGTYQPGAKVIIGNEVIIDLTQDDVTEADVAQGKKFHKRNGAAAYGTSTKDADTSDGDALAGEILSGKKAYVAGQKLTGTMANQGAKALKVSHKDNPVSIPAGYHDGSGTAAIDDTEAAKLIPGNIKDGVTILGVEGEYTGEAISAGAVDVTPTLSAQTILPSSVSKDYISQVNVAAIPVVVTTHQASGGLVYTIG